MPTEQLYNQHSSPPSMKTKIQPFGAKKFRVPLQSLEPEFVPSASPVSKGAGGLTVGLASRPVADAVKIASAASQAGQLATAPLPEVDLFAPLETTDWKKYWPLAATAVGAIGLIFLLRRRKK